MKSTFRISILAAMFLCSTTAWAQADNYANYTERVSGVVIDMVYVRGGTFTMGCTGEQRYDCWEKEKPVHQVTVSSYYIGKYEVTQAQWKAVMGNNPSYSKGDNLPVENVNWENVQAFIKQLNRLTGKKFRLPTEAEWEYAADEDTTHPVGTKNANELGIYDMSGNVLEWCSDWYGSYSSSSQTNPTGASSGSYRVMRGGAWGCSEWQCRVSCRSSVSPDYDIHGEVGFRLACSSNR